MVGVGVGEVVGGGVGEVVGGGGEVVGVTPPVQVMPLRVNTVGFGLVLPFQEPLKPTSTAVLVGIAAL